MVAGLRHGAGDRRAAEPLARYCAGAVHACRPSDADADLRAHIRAARADALPPGRHLRDGPGDDAVDDSSCACAASRACGSSTRR